MFPDIVPVSCLDPSSLQIGENYLVGEVKDPAVFGALQKTELVGKFEGLNALFDYQQEHQPVPKRGRSSDKNEGGNFHHFHNFQECIDVYRNDPSQITEFEAINDYLNGGDVGGKELEWGVQGDFLDVGRFLEGEPECFGSLTNGNPRSKRVQITLNNTWASVVNKKTILYRSKRLLRLVDWLEGQGVRTSIVSISSSQVEHLEIIVKRFDEPLSITDLAIVAHSDFLRRIIFRFDEYSKTWKEYYGSARVLGQKYDASKWESAYNGEYSVFVDSSAGLDNPTIDREFDELEKRLTGLMVDELDDPETVMRICH